MYMIYTIKPLPLDSSTSDVKRIVKGKFSGTIGLIPLSARAPCPISRRINGFKRPISLVAYGGNS